MKVFLVTTLVLVIAFLEKREARMTRMARSDPTGPGLVEVGELLIEKVKRVGDFGFGERTRPRMGKRIYETGMENIIVKSFLNLCHLFILTV